MSKLKVWLTKTNTGRTVSHAAIAIATVVVPLLVFTSIPALKASILAALPAAGAALFRTVAPNDPGTVPAPSGIEVPLVATPVTTDPTTPPATPTP